MNDLLIFLVLAGIALIFRWLSGQGPQDSEKPGSPSPNERPERPPAETEEERVRRFLEALGVPPGSAPPLPVRPRPTAARRVVTPSQPKAPPKVKRSWVQPLPPLVTTPKDVTYPPARPPAPAPPPPPPVVIVAPAPATISPRVATSPTPQAAPVSAATMGSLGAILRARGSVRQAIMLREILGPPRGLQALDELRSF